MNPDEKTCPCCAETINAASLRCKRCHADLTGAAPAPAVASPAATSAPAPATPDVKSRQASEDADGRVGELAQTLGCSVRTVNARLGEVYRKLGMQNLVEAYIKGLRFVLPFILIGPYILVTSKTRAKLPAPFQSDPLTHARKQLISPAP